jgi:F-type H+-transporting ATPase subunit a
VGESVSSDQPASGEAATAAIAVADAPAKRGRRIDFRLLIPAVIALNVLAYLFVPPFPKGEAAGSACDFPVCFINGTLEFPAPHVVLDLDPTTAPAAGALLSFHPSITNTMITMWIVAALVLFVFILAGRRRQLVPGGFQNAIEAMYEALTNFAVSIGGEAARRYVPIFAAFFVLILFCNWSGLVPPVGRIEELRAPTSDVNMTIGLALVSFSLFHIEGVRNLGLRPYLAKFFPLYEFRKGIGAGVIALFVGLIELLLEFVKPLTLSMRLFGNIYGGEVALGVITALTVTIIPVALFGLEFILNFVQALIFSVLTLMFTLAAIESHQPDEGHLGEEAVEAVEDAVHPHPAGARPAPAR